MLETIDLELGHGGPALLRGLGLSARPGELLAVLGPNGAGKTTLLKTLAHLMPARAGHARLDGIPLAGLGRAARARRVAYLPQAGPAAAVTVYEAVLLGRLPHLGWRVGGNDLERVDDILNHLGLAALSGRPCDRLSGGELQKVMIGRALAQAPRLLLLDEPANHLDLANQIEVLELVRRTTRTHDLITLVVLHDLNLALRFADRFLLLDGHGGHASGTMDDLEPGLVERVYRIPVARGNIAGHTLLIPT